MESEAGGGGEVEVGMEAEGRDGESANGNENGSENGSENESESENENENESGNENGGDAAPAKEFTDAACFFEPTLTAQRLGWRRRAYWSRVGRFPR